MSEFTPAAIEQKLLTETEFLLARIEVVSSRLENLSDVKGLILLIDQVSDNVTALTGEPTLEEDQSRDRNIEAEYLFSQPHVLTRTARTAIHREMLRLALRIRETLNPPKDEEFPF
jgi:hypothetical protein